MKAIEFMAQKFGVYKTAYAKDAIAIEQLLTDYGKIVQEKQIKLCGGTMDDHHIFDGLTTSEYKKAIVNVKRVIE